MHTASGNLPVSHEPGLHHTIMNELCALKPGESIAVLFPHWHTGSTMAHGLFAVIIMKASNSAHQR